MAVFGKKLCELPSIFAIMLCVRFITAIREDIMEKTQQYSTPYEFEGKLPLRQAIPLGLQHVLAMFVGNLTPILIITSLCAAGGGAEEFAAIQVSLLQNAMLVAGLVTLVQLFAIGPVGGKVPIIMGTSSGFIGVSSLRRSWALF